MNAIDSDRWRQIEDILDAALDVPSTEREALLREQCGEDVALRAEVERMLAACANASGMFESPPTLTAADFAGDADADRDTIEPGDVIGRYRVIELIGRGGMGAVYLAERADGAYDKKVALKLVKRGMDTDEIVARFERERQILANLEHPNIARLLDGGVTPSGLPYFVMELVRGEPIDEQCDRERLDIGARLRLFRAVCDAVRHAHANLIVHRDLKPGNILIANGEPKLLDFGIAKVLEDGSGADPAATRLAERRLTPRFAAPEQVRGEPTTTATDTYALGVILYELLTGRRPYIVRGGGYTEIERTICETEPKPPSSVVLRDDVEGEGAAALDLAALRGTTPQALRQRLRGDLDAIVLKALQKEPARRYPSVEALAEDLGRHLAGRPVTARPDSTRYRISKFVRRNRTPVALAAAAAFALIAGSIATARMAWVAAHERDQRQLEAQRATTARDFVVNLFAELDPDNLRGRTEFTRDEIIDLGAQSLDRLEDQPELLASVLNTLGQVAFNLGDRERALSFFQRAHSILIDRGAHPDLAVAMAGLGEVFRLDQQFDEAQRWLADALEVRRAALNADDGGIAESMAALAFLHYNKEEYDEAEQLNREVLAFPGGVSPGLRADVLERLGDIQLGRRRLEEADRLYHEALAERRRILGPNHPHNARTLWGIGHVLEVMAREALADTLSRKSFLSQAEQTYREALEILVATYGIEHPSVADNRYTLGRVLGEQNRHEEALDELAEAVRVFGIVYPLHHPSLGDAWTALARSELRQGRPSAAEEAAGHAIDSYAANTPSGGASDWPDWVVERLAIARRWLGEALLEQRRFAEAETALRFALGELQQRSGREADLPAIAAALAEVFEATGRPDSAHVYRTRALQPDP
ncbi:MAG: protein kinase domain-containing protein [Longimicrobiales bacterium]